MAFELFTRFCKINSTLIYMPIVIDKELYDLVKQKADEVYKKPSAYKSGYIVKTYKQLGGRYQDDNKTKI